MMMNLLNDFYHQALFATRLFFAVVFEFETLMNKLFLRIPFSFFFMNEMINTVTFLFLTYFFNVIWHQASLLLFILHFNFSD